MTSEYNTSPSDSNNVLVIVSFVLCSVLFGVSMHVLLDGSVV